MATDARPLTERIAEQAKRVEGASAEYERTIACSDQARRDSIKALNALNAAQKEFDRLVLSLSEAAPRGSGWTETRTMQPV